ERRHLSRRTGEILAMAARAIAVVERAMIARDHAEQPRHLVGVHVEQRRLRIEGRAAPFRAAVVTREDDDSLARGRREETVRRVLPERRERRRTRLRRARGEHVFRQALAREWRRSERERLRLGAALALERRRGHLAILDREEWLSVLAIEHEDVPGLGDLRERVDASSVAGHGDERRRSGEVEIPEVVLDRLKVPDAPTRARVEREHRVGEEIVAVPIRTVEVERG